MIRKNKFTSRLRPYQTWPECAIRYEITPGREVQALGPGRKREKRGRVSRADWRAGGALAQFRLMSGQLEVHHSALCTAAVSLNLCCCGPYPQPGHSPREALTLRPILLWQLHSTRSNAKRYCDVYTVTLYSLSLTTRRRCVCRAGAGWKGEMTLKEKSGEGETGGRLQRLQRKREKRKNIQQRGPFLYPNLWSLSTNIHLFQLSVDGPLQILVFVFKGTAASSDSIGGLLCLFVLFCLQDFIEKPEDGVEAHPGGQLMPLRAYI